MFDVLVTSVPQLRAGRVRGLAVTSARRSPFAPDIPTMAESGVPGYAEAGSDLWFGIVAPAGVPKPVVDKLNAELIRVLRSTAMRERISGQFFDVWTSTPAEFQKVIESDYAKWGKIVRASGARVD
jgi:tripartite-type tricarboxylate transporter receptor subunit TctC